MKNTIHKLVLGALLLSLAHLAQANIFVIDLSYNNSTTYPIPGNQAWGGQLGDDFTTNTDIWLTSIGVFDDDGDGTAGALYWQLFNVTNGALIHAQTVSATGTRTPGTTIVDNYVWASLSSSIYLAAGGIYSVVAYGFDSADKNFNTNFDLANHDVDFSSIGITSHGGRYSNCTTACSSRPTTGAGNAASAQPWNFGAATFAYNLPEPATLALMGLGLLGLGFNRRKN